MNLVRHTTEQFWSLARAIWSVYSRAVEDISARPRRAVALLLLFMVPAGILAVQFLADVQTGFEELLPKDAPSVLALNRLHDRLGGVSHLAVIAHGADAESNRRFITDLETRVRARNIPEARIVQGSVALERKWLQERAPLLLPRDRFDELLDQIDAGVARAKADANPLLVNLDDNAAGGGDTKQAWENLEKTLEAERAKVDRFPNGYMEMPDGSHVVLLLWLRGSETELEPALNLLTAVKQEVAAARAAGHYPDALKLGYTGEVPNLIEEHDAILADLSLSSVIVFLFVGGLIIAYFRSLRGVMTVLMALAPGLILTFAIGRLTVGHVNSNTAFLGSIIAGNGINYPLLLLAYYRARSPSEKRSFAIITAARQALPGTLGAAATASAAYGGLAVSTFKGFSQFGWLGGAGMVTAWLLTYITMPIAISVLNPPRHGEQITTAQGSLLAFFSRRRAPALLAGAIFIAVALVGGYGVHRASREGMFDMDLRGLRNRESFKSGSASWDPKMCEIYGVFLNPVAALVDDPAHREAVAAEMKRALVVESGKARGELAVAERVETIAAYAPDPVDQEARLTRLRKLAATLAKVPREQVPEKARPYVDRWLAPENLRPIEPSEVPLALRQPFIEKSGRMDRVVLLYPSMKVNYNDARNILRFADEMRATKLPGDAVAGGGFLFMAEIIGLVEKEAPKVVLVVCALVALVLVPFFISKPLRIPLVVATVVLVAFASQAVMFAVGVQLNMINFAAVPITIGVGADYVLNLLGAMSAYEVDARRGCARMGGAILLCSLTTVVGYSTLLVAQSGALRTFGWAAVLGELMAVTTVLFILPVLLAARLQSSGSGPQERRELTATGS